MSIKTREKSQVVKGEFGGTFHHESEFYSEIIIMRIWYIKDVKKVNMLS